VGRAVPSYLPGPAAECRRGLHSCGSLPLMRCTGWPAGRLDVGGFMSDVVLVPYADAKLVSAAVTVDPIACRLPPRSSDNHPRRLVPRDWPVPANWPAFEPVRIVVCRGDGKKGLGVDRDVRRLASRGRSGFPVVTGLTHNRPWPARRRRNSVGAGGRSRRCQAGYSWDHYRSPCSTSGDPSNWQGGNCAPLWPERRLHRKKPASTSNSSKPTV